MRKTLCTALMAMLLAACQKDIALDYRQVSPLYVAEATLTQEKMSVRLSTTQDVEDNDRAAHTLEGATIVLSSEGYELATLTDQKKGLYTADVAGMPGFTYDLDIYVGGQHFTSSSTMQDMPQLNSFRFVWMKVLQQRMLFADLRLQDLPGQNNYYFMHIYRNGIGYRWAVMRDDVNPNGELQQLFRCVSEKEMDDGDSDALQDGDRIRVEIRSIDRASYDYLYSMQVMDSAGSNPVANFTGGCLGYFSAYSYITYSMRFYREQVEDE